MHLNTEHQTHLITQNDSLNIQVVDSSKLWNCHLDILEEFEDVLMAA
jgi:hypothetical protein